MTSGLTSPFDSQKLCDFVQVASQTLRLFPSIRYEQYLPYLIDALKVTAVAVQLVVVARPSPFLCSGLSSSWHLNAVRLIYNVMPEG